MLQHDKRTFQASPVAALSFLERPPGGHDMAEPEGDPRVRELAGPIRYTCTRVVPLELDRLRDDALLHDRAGDPGAEAFRMLRTQVLFWLAERQGSSLAITSPGAGEGKTVTALNLAIQIANEVDYTVLLVDANLRSPAVHRLFGLDTERGLASHLLEGDRLQDLLVNPGLGRLVVLGAGRPQSNSAELLGSRAMARLVGELKARYPRRIVLFDLPPVLDSADVLAFSRHVDGILMVVSEGRSARAELVRAEGLLPPEKLVGVAMTGVRAARQGPVHRERRSWFGWGRSR